MYICIARACQYVIHWLFWPTAVSTDKGLLHLFIFTASRWKRSYKHGSDKQAILFISTTYKFLVNVFPSKYMQNGFHAISLLLDLIILFAAAYILSFLCGRELGIHQCLFKVCHIIMFETKMSEFLSKFHIDVNDVCQ